MADDTPAGRRQGDLAYKTWLVRGASSNFSSALVVHGPRFVAQGTKESSYQTRTWSACDPQPWALNQLRPLCTTNNLDPRAAQIPVVAAALTVVVSFGLQRDTTTVLCMHRNVSNYPIAFAPDCESVVKSE